MPGLSKENFFNEMVSKYPTAMAKFCSWIDDWKLDNGWDDIVAEHIKFHDLPAEMQIGIWLRFVSERTTTRYMIGTRDFSFRRGFEASLMAIEFNEN